MTTGNKPTSTSWAGLVMQQQRQQGDHRCSAGQESIASENSCETVAGPSARPRSTDAKEPAMTTQADRFVAPIQLKQGLQATKGARTAALVPKEQICFDFTKGQCRRGEGCKFSHDVAHIIRVNSQEKGICFDFLRGTCARGVMCRFSHDLNNLEAQDQLGVANAGRAMRSTNVSICYDFIKNKCTKGEACRYSHEYSAILNKMTGSHRDSGSFTPPRGSMPHPEVIGATSRTPDRHQYMSSGGQTCVDYMRGGCPRGPFCEMSHSKPAGRREVLPGGDGHPESLESLINRLKKMQYDQSMVAENTAMLGSPQHGMMHAGNSPPPFHHSAHHVHNTFSYPPLSSVYSEGARLMSAHWSDRHGLFENENHHVSPMSPPVTVAEKAKLSLRRELLRQQGIGGQHLTALSCTDPNDTTGGGSPMIGAGWQIPHKTDAVPGEHDSAEAFDAPIAADDLINMMTTTIWPDEHA